MGQSARRMSPMSLFMLSMNGIIGSGWLFVPFYAAKIVGSAAILSWLIGGFATILIAFTFAELSIMLPVSGTTAHIPQFSHGVLASFIMSFVAWLPAVMLAPIEVQAILQYASLFFPSLLHDHHGVPVLSLLGYFWAFIFMVMLCVLNAISYKSLVRFNFLLFVFKFFVLLITIVVIFHARFTVSNFSSFTPSIFSSQGLQLVLSAIATSGIIFAFNGFKSGVDLAGETKNLNVAIPLSTIGSVVTCLLLYLGLQIAFIGALDPAFIKNGWQSINYSGDTGPFLGLAAGLGIMWLFYLLYANSIIAPFGAGLIYVTSTARILYAMSRMGYVPRFISRLNHARFPVWAIVVNFFVGIISFLPLPGWQAMVSFLVSAVVITYAMGPIALLCLRMTLPHAERPFRLKAAYIICPVAFYFCNLFSYWTGWQTISKFAIVLLFGLGLFSIAYVRGRLQITKRDFQSSLWIIVYLCGLIMISYLGSFGGRNIIPFGWDFLIIAIFSLAIFQMALQSRIQHHSEKISEFLLAESAYFNEKN